MPRSLHELCAAWRAWAANADHSESGWQSDFPDWPALLHAAEEAMLLPDPDEATLRDIELGWAISEETEDLADFAIEHLDRCWGVLEHLATSDDSDVRWQVYHALGFAGQRADLLLRVGLADHDAYPRRRAVLSLARLRPADAAQLAERLLRDEDPYMRQAGAELLPPPSGNSQSGGPASSRP